MRYTSGLNFPVLLLPTRILPAHDPMQIVQSQKSIRGDFVFADGRTGIPDEDGHDASGMRLWLCTAGSSTSLSSEKVEGEVHTSDLETLPFLQVDVFRTSQTQHWTH